MARSKIKSENADGFRMTPYRVLCIVVLIVMAFLFLFPLYWIVTGAFKPMSSINSVTPEWFPSAWVLDNFKKLFSRQKATLFGATVPAAARWLYNTVFMAVMAMVLTCITATMAGYVLAKKRFIGATVLFSLIVAAMALPKQVILIPLLKEMSALGLYNNIWAAILPTVGWPFGIFLMKQFSESIPDELIQAAQIDGASEWRIFTQIVVPMVKPGIGALAIFTFINSWNDYFMQLIMLSNNEALTISLGIAKLQAENATDYGLIMAGATLAAVPILTVFLIFQKYFTKGIAVGAVKG